MKTSAVDKGLHSSAIYGGLLAAAAARSYSWVEEMENDTGADILEGSVVVVLADGTIELADTVNEPRPTGVVVDQIDDGDTGQVVFGGPVDLVLVTASVTAGDYGQTSTTPGEAQVAPGHATAFCEFTESGTTPSAFLWGGRGGGGVIAGLELALDDLSDVTITSPAEDDDLRYNGSAWINDSRKWEAVTDGEDVFVWEGDDLVHEWSS
jgi:hypothetical protein